MSSCVILFGLHVLLDISYLVFGGQIFAVLFVFFWRFGSLQNLDVLVCLFDV